MPKENAISTPNIRIVDFSVHFMPCIFDNKLIKLSLHVFLTKKNLALNMNEIDLKPWSSPITLIKLCPPLWLAYPSNA